MPQKKLSSVEEKVLTINPLYALAVLLVIAAVLFFFVQNRSHHGESGRDFKPFEIKYSFGDAKVYSARERNWVSATRGTLLSVGSKIRTQKDSGIDFFMSDKTHFRLKENSELELNKPDFFDVGPRRKMYLPKGTLLGLTENESGQIDGVDIFTGRLHAHVKDAVFEIKSDPVGKKDFLGVLRGTVEAVSKSGWKRQLNVRRLEKVETTSDGRFPKEPVRIAKSDWNQMKEAYQLIPVTAASEAKQLDLSKKAGNLFDYVFDHGTFYSPEIGFANREFELDEKTGEVGLKVEYDVFPVPAIVGLYFKTRNFDLSKFDALEFDVRTVKGEDSPDSFRVELKTNLGILRASKPRNFEPVWRTANFPFYANTQSKLIQEVTMVFTHETAGVNKRGMLEFRNFKLIPKPQSKPLNS
ncbi:MAG: hypothetical protein A3G33_05050 [Omnitrophica bacterium RIFCSPLOWO2_12_FULL_44_17]|uniref:FecR protein domain-containing protein n=1 Tax=Candidatus Danuiimicrobium aquiferis TaxID=1801832 RepID=A0A1G1KX85_9BACT|nr:MAG: hypothetical protein A3B72_01420 [Omnitrophica bacterium RIFCSPHIGHO2_02_FULL_45_28]OGW89145.1 MAG: hypothetical protein A3E74_06215 [Omnitrophica bacterium RIFCSPHIGHO2_12_FULL_44_12]OGW97524.1 MAG: hypothetical protein A3G33_05050 [Omnitrophica bacterium RIFCSPLOWO2_12_FULL_44_17]OGX02077.1 MAG: hypothetical protein A3J12_06345 [Omnitrophica bacterium RIFCSPLOWO2_02_FULL_44_11]